MPGAMSPQFSNNIYPTYAYQKVDESKLKSYTRYLVRGFVGNSKDLELLVERYGKEVYVEMDVPNDIVYNMPPNECGDWNRCDYQMIPTHTCTCNETSSMNTRYLQPESMEKPARKSCECKDPHMFSYHIDTGCMDLVENLGLLFALKIASTDGVAKIDNLEIIEGAPLTGEALARVKKREHKWKEEMKQKRCKSDLAIKAAQDAIGNLFTSPQQDQLKFETILRNILDAEILVQRIPYVYHPFLIDALPSVPGMNFEIVQQLSASISTAQRLYDQRNLVINGDFSSGVANWNVLEGVEVRSEGNASVLVLSEWNDTGFQNLRIDPDRGYVLRVTARKEGAGESYVVISDCDNAIEKLRFTSCDDVGDSVVPMPVDPTCMPCKHTAWSEDMTPPPTMLAGYVTRTADIFPDTEQIRIDIGETERTFKIVSIELICMEQMDDVYDMTGNMSR
ncbi:pesticidial crystal protein [Bacillus cereus]|nr:pesticidial crystal protein [Bacillus cereus]